MLIETTSAPHSTALRTVEFSCDLCPLILNSTGIATALPDLASPLRLSKGPKGPSWLNDGSCVRLRPERPNHVWSYDFVQDRTEDGRTFRMLCVIDEFTRRCLAIVVARRLQSDDVLQSLTDLFFEHGPRSTSGQTTGRSPRKNRVNRL